MKKKHAFHNRFLCKCHSLRIQTRLNESKCDTFNSRATKYFDWIAGRNIITEWPPAVRPRLSVALLRPLIVVLFTRIYGVYGSQAATQSKASACNYRKMQILCTCVSVFSLIQAVTWFGILVNLLERDSMELATFSYSFHVIANRQQQPNVINQHKRQLINIAC